MRPRKLIFVTGLLFVSCVSEDPVPPIADLDYQLFCDRGSGCNGLVNEPKHRVERGIDGQDGFRIYCSAGEKISDLNLSLVQTGYAISIRGESSAKSQKCSLRVEEGNNTYEKSCIISKGGNADCSEEASREFSENVADMPCQVSVVKDGSTVSGTACCRNIPLEYRQALGNEFSLVSSQDFTKPASFDFENCN
ncbi:MAG: hypothetical protein JXA30_03395 [Deltaproteobacteria bacterium]|nr:hypothetical protein [Deltaproteobacteria bacterium]